MKKVLIKAAYTGHYKNAQHAAFMQFFKTAIIVRYPEINQKYPELSAAFVRAYDHENAVFDKVDRTLFNKDLNVLNTERGIKFRILRNSAKIFLLVADPQKVKAAEILMEVMKLYGGTGIIGQGMDSETGLLSNLVEDLEGPYAEQVTLLGLTEKLADLKAANDLYVETLADRTQFDADHGKSAVAEARKATDKAYLNLVYVINADNDTAPSVELNEFSAFVNAEIDRYRIKLGLGTGNSTSNSVEEDDETPREKFATFTFVNGSQQRFPVEVGAPLVAPANTPGYMWKPKVPEIMPATSKNFREVSIDSVKYTATFHFLDHSEEEIQAVAGAELIAPENTTGCVWEPTVPATMPAEDTTYNEVLAQNNEEEEDDGQRTVTFTFINGEKKVVKGEPGEALTYPTNTAGYIWSTSDSNPSKIPAQNFRVIEVPDNVPLFTIVWFSDPTTPIQWFMLPVGHEVPAAPAAPAGDPWSVSVSVMPDHNLYILPESMAEEEEED